MWPWKVSIPRIRSIVKERITKYEGHKRARNIIEQEVIFEHDNGLSNEEVSRLIGIPESTVRYFLKEA